MGLAQKEHYGQHEHVGPKGAFSKLYNSITAVIFNMNSKTIAVDNNCGKYHLLPSNICLSRDTVGQ